MGLQLPRDLADQIFGTEGGAYVGGRDKVELYTMLNSQEVAIQTPLHEAKVGSYLTLIENFVRRVDGDATADIPTPEQALVAVKIIDAVGRSAAAGREVVV